ncbi:heterokaryon incompatibility protein-domain-containing protein [Aspergillus welwitschiae]|uniref:Heterokaryon incompatibility protein-domain-containing protein n=1 Tax=Aspergillus welwitschiae TaxID=1341132 RepID=A0A3F3Q2T1_9EURO|nr:heterokaryon incompatibility protein-domain-containing protein [Aspergillus welwitschiae]RDH32986.1 heterokaryon incompatibility protein-domain-containing protein [Aspergillus welwitschiae]
MMPLSYLDPSASQIRLLTIIPDENDENPVCGSLHTVSLNDTCDFDALSYVWGDTSVTVDISVDDCLVGVTPNLHAFLRRLRQPNSERTVWVDYVCINQNDISERNSQVALMYQIYSNARSVVAWLGDLTPEALELIEWYHANRNGFYLERRGLLHIAQATDRMVRLANALCSSPYWHRLWTFQEWHLSRNAPVCMHEKSTFTIGNIFNRLHDEVAVARSRLTPDTISSNGPPIGYPYERCQANGSIMLLLYLQQKLDTLVSNIPQDILHLNPYTPRLSGLGDLLSLTMGRQCSNELDKVYALYGFSPVARETYPPDYRKTTSRVNHETTSFILGHEVNMKIFNDFDFCFNSVNKHESLPSWVLDFTTTDPEHREKMQRSFSKTMNLDKALWKQSKNHGPIIADNMQTLKLWCRKVGVSTGSLVLHSDVSRCLDQVQLIAKAFKKHGKDRFPNIYDTTIKAAYYYTGCSEIVHLNVFYEIMKMSLLDKLEEYQEVTKGSFSTLYLSAAQLTGKLWFHMITSAGDSIGLTDCEIKKGDILVIPCGIAQVFILRPIPEELLVDGEEVQYFKVIGRAYVEGISDRGEALPDPLRSEMENTSPTLFCLR